MLLLLIAQACDEAAAAAPPPSPSNLAGWLFLALLVAAGLLDYWLYRTGRQTMSKWIREHTRHPHLIKALGASLIGLLLWHLFLGGPLPLP